MTNPLHPAIAEGPRDASCQLKSCQLPRSSAETTCTTSPEQIEVMKLKRYSKAVCNKQVHPTMTRSSGFHCLIGDVDMSRRAITCLICTEFQRCRHNLLTSSFQTCARVHAGQHAPRRTRIVESALPKTPCLCRRCPHSMRCTAYVTTDCLSRRSTSAACRSMGASIRYRSISVGTRAAAAGSVMLKMRAEVRGTRLKSCLD